MCIFLKNSNTFFKILNIFLLRGVCVFNYQKRLEVVQWTILLLLLSHFSGVWLCATPETAAHQVPCPWDSPGKNTRVGCHFLLQCMTVKSKSEVTQSCPTLSDPMDYSPPGSSVHGIFQARVLEWGAIAFSHSCTKTGRGPDLAYGP